MKTLADLNALIPILVDLLKNNDHEIGESHYERNEDGWGRCDDNSANMLSYEDEGWFIEITYECCGEWDSFLGNYWEQSHRNLRKAWGRVTDITVCYCDNNTSEPIVFDGDDLNELWDSLDKVLEKI